MESGETAMKNAPINLSPLPDYALYADKDMQNYARAAILADRAAASAEPPIPAQLQGEMAYAARCHAAASRLLAEGSAIHGDDLADPRTVEELRAALAELTARCDGEEGVRADGSNIQTMRAHAALDAAPSPAEPPVAPVQQFGRFEGADDN
jgi:hypothetical protein